MVEKGRGWYRFRILLHRTGDIPLNALQAMNKKFPFAFFDAGMIDLRDKRYDWLRLLDKDRFEKNSDRFCTLYYLRLSSSFDPIELSKSRYGGKTKSSRNYFGRVNHLQTASEPNIEGLITTSALIRKWESIGSGFSIQQTFQDCLCDDMGLGKPIRLWRCWPALRIFPPLLQKELSHFLIVCPTSVIYHWQEKIKHFCPV